jgi:hypothetical protein
MVFELNVLIAHVETSLLHAGFLLGLFFDLEDGSNLLLRKALQVQHSAIPQKIELFL